RYRNVHWKDEYRIRLWRRRLDCGADHVDLLLGADPLLRWGIYAGLRDNSWNARRAVNQCRTREGEGGRKGSRENCRASAAAQSAVTVELCTDACLVADITVAGSKRQRIQPGRVTSTLTPPSPRG